LGDAIEALTKTGRTVAAHRQVPEKLCYRTLLKFDEKEGKLLETDA